MPMNSLRILPLSILSLTTIGAAQDLIGVNFTGQAVLINSRTGVGSVLGTTSKTGHNAMARSGRSLIVNEISGTGTSAQHFLDVLDEQLGSASRSVQVTADLRGLATSQPFQLMGIAQATPSDTFVQVDLFNGTVTPRGPTGFGSVQALALHQGSFYAWDLTAGLLKINLQTGAATDVNQNVGTGGAAIQFLTSMSDGRLLGGMDSLYSIDAATGIATLIGSGGYSDVRGAAERFGSAVAFGTGCSGIGLKVSGVPKPGNFLTSTSIAHTANAAGVVMLGFSNTVSQGLTLPLNLDPLLGTAGCSLLVSPDFSFQLAANNVGVMAFQFQLTGATNGMIFHMQHAAFHQAPGGLAFTNGVTVRVAL